MAAAMRAYGARWSPDGTRVAFVDGLVQRLTVFDFTRDLVAIPGELAVAFDWSPNSRWLVIEEIVVADAATGATRRLSTEAASADTLPVWSPDGRRLLLVRQSLSRSLDPAQVWLVASTGQSPPRLLGEGDTAVWLP